MSVAQTAMPRAGEAEWAARVDLAACYRLIAHYRMADLIYTHVSLRVPGERDRFLVNPYGTLFEDITASSLVTVGHDGQALEGDGAVNPAGFTIHSAVHAAREDAHCVIHTHTRAGVAVSALAAGVLPISQFALAFYDDLAYHDYEGVALNHTERERIAHDLGSKNCLVLRNHGLLTVGRNAAEAFSRMFYLNRACEVQVDAMSTGGELVVPPPEVCRLAYEQQRIGLIGENGDDMMREWAAHLRVLERSNPGHAA